MEYRYLILALIILVNISCSNDSSIKNEKALLEKRVLEKRVLKSKLTEKKSKKTNYNNSSNVSSKSLSNNCKEFATLKFDASYTCIIKSSLSVSKINGYYTNIDIDNFYKTVNVSDKCIKGTYEFNWTFYSQCVNFGKPDGPYSFSGKFYIDGEYSYYTIFVSDGMFNTSISVKGY